MGLLTAAAITYPVDALVSYHYFRNPEHMHLVTDHARLRLIGDSGAFSAYTSGKPITVAEFARWALRWRDRLLWVASLDVIGDPKATWENWRQLTSEYGLVTVPTVHVGTDLKWITAYADQGVDFVGLGGMVGMSSQRALRWIVSVLRYTRENHPQMRFHGWGVSGAIADQVPLYSVDSSGTVSSATRFASLILYHPVTRKMALIKLDGRTPYAHSDLLRRFYGVSPADIARSSAANRHIIVELCVKSTQLYAAMCSQRWEVTQPGHGINTGWAGHAGGEVSTAAGPRVHISDPSMFDMTVMQGLSKEHVTRERLHMVLAGIRERHAAGGKDHQCMCGVGK